MDTKKYNFISDRLNTIDGLTYTSSTFEWELNLRGIIFVMENQMEDVHKMRWIRNGNGVVLG